MSDIPQTLRQRLMRRKAALWTERRSWEAHWRDLSDHILPRRARFLASDTNKGGKINTTIVDTTGTIAARTLAAGMMSGMSSPARPWFKLEPDDLDLLEDGEVKAWLAKLERLVRRIFHASNVYNALPLLYEELGVFGTGCAIVEDDFEDVIRLAPLTVGEYALALNKRREVDTLFREFQMTVHQCVEEFGLKACSETVRNQYDRGQYDNWVPVIHAIEPNTDRDASKADAGNLPFRSCYFERDARVGDDGYLRRSGYKSNPIIAPRWHVVGNDVYGRSPGMEALPDIRQLQIQQKRKGTAIDKVVNPPTQGPPSTQDRYINRLPGAHNIVADTTGQGIKALYDVRPDIGALREDIEATQERVREAFFFYQFLAISQMEGVQPRNQFELAERKEEKLLVLGPVVERLQNEMHSRLINRAIERVIEVSEPFWKMGEPGMIEPPPKALQGMPLAITFISMLAQVQKGVATASIERLYAFGGNLAAVNPQVLDKLDFDQAIDEMADAVGAPAGVVRSDDAVEALRQQRAQAEQAKQVGEAMPALADAAGAAKTLSETQIGGGRSALQAMLGTS